MRVRRRTISPLSQTLPRRVTPELECLQVKWAAHLSYKSATTLLKEVLPLQTAISITSAKRHLRIVGWQLDAQIERGITKMAPPVDVARARARESRQVTAVSVDSV